jgi:hypothetical protein
MNFGLMTMHLHGCKDDIDGSMMNLNVAGKGALCLLFLVSPVDLQISMVFKRF